MSLGTLYICPTPLGNLDDITLRVLQVLRSVDKIAAEDTRHTRKLLSHFEIRAVLTSYHEHNKQKKTPVLIDWLLSGLDIALVSDAGTPGIADPGEELVKEAIAHEIPIVPLPGPVAVITALVASGLPASPCTFYGFLPVRGSKRKETLDKIAREDKTVIFYEAPHRLVKTLQALEERQPGRPAVVARELTKLHEEFKRGSLEEILAYYRENSPRGECTVLLAPAEPEVLQTEDPLELLEKLMSAGLNKKEAMRQVSQTLDISRNELYSLILQKK
ncbi:16S rRNA (cytidine(1402)-2'-O)-methyltransferase [Dethiobacter alkaliphilus]|uniref:Ribosomal RNA small subunit methyltransferase I n=1 Tax=Dethiobacter alkaliphilus AHT 1 TaxID=555088 RepID=C0GJA5_DETAL|nr:16S rRNA (cytidine(1402)-2'-O)-methyltransferase [Dethiobacter alkaliphilus]EEG76590.1 Uroporphyrin-III C/tetrapyrrole (Corrin/Porphyrin) methyltransferase [Dethiobacter alkaliphilus AHT 1]